MEKGYKIEGQYSPSGRRRTVMRSVFGEVPDTVEKLVVNRRDRGVINKDEVTYEFRF